MSLEAMIWALEEAPDVPAHCLGTLMGLANHADKQGRGAYAGQKLLAEYARKTDRQARSDLAVLLERGLIRRGDQSLAKYIPTDARPVVYDLAMERKQASARKSASARKHTSKTTLEQNADQQEQEGDGSTLPGGSTLPRGAEADFRAEADDRKHASDKPKNLPSEGSNETSSSAKATRGTRIPGDFTVSRDMVTWCRQSCPHVNGPRETEKFINYWTAKSGRDAAKVDWPRTWMNWMINAEERSPQAQAASNGSGPGPRVNPRDEHRLRK